MPEEQVKSRDPYAALKIKDFRFMLAFRFFFTLGVQIQYVIVGWQIYKLTKDPLSLGLIGLAEAVPFLASALFSGYLADRLNRKKIILMGAIGYWISAACLFTFSTFLKDHVGVAAIYAVVSLTGLARALLGPSFQALISQVLPRHLYANGSTWNSTIWQIGAVTGPALGGLIAGFISIEFAYGVVLVLVGIAISAIFLLGSYKKPAFQYGEQLFTSLGKGLKFVFSNQLILGALSLDLFAVLFGGAVALLPVFASDVLKVGAQGLGILRAAPSVGAIVMSLVLAFKPVEHKAGLKLLFAVGCFGACMIGFGLSTNFYLSLFWLMLGGMFDNVSVVLRGTILQLQTPDEMRGRVSSVNSVFIGSSNEIGAFESGLAAKYLGLVRSVVAGGCMTILVVTGTGIIAKKLRGLTLGQE